MANHRPGFITASTVGPFLTGKTGKLIAGGINAARNIAAERERLIDPEQDNGFSGSIHTEWGNEHEADAIAAYERERMVEVHGQQDVVVQGWLSCTPDGLVGADGLVEVKCPSKMENHKENLLRNAWVSQYFDQVQFQMMLTGRAWCDLISYDPRQAEWAKLHVVRIARDESRIAFIQDRMRQAEAVITEELALIEAVKLSKKL